MADTTRESKTILTAEDKTAGAFASFQKSIAGAAAQMQGMQGMLAGLTAGGLGLLVGGFAAMTVKAMEAADHMGKLAQKAGVTTEEMSKLAYAAKLSDVETGSLTKGIKALSEQMVAATNKTSEAASIMKMMGVDIKGGVAPALEKIADQFAALPDGATKVALAVKLFGKAGQDMIPMLNEGGAGIRKMKEEAEAMGVVISGETAAAAQKFNDNMRAMKTGAESMANTLATKTAAALADVTTAMKEAYKETGLLGAAIIGLGGIAAKIFTDDSMTQSERIAKQMAEITGRMQQTQQKLQDAQDMVGKAGEQWRAGILAGLQKDFNELSGLAKQLATIKIDADKDRVKKLWEDYYKTENEAKVRGELALGDARKKAAEDIAKYNEKMRQEDIKGWVAYAQNVFDEADKLNLDMAKINGDFWKGEDKLKADDIAGWVKYADAVFEEADKLNLDIAKINGEFWKEQDKLREEDMRREVDMWDSIGGTAGNFFGDLVVYGKSAFDSLKQSLKSFAADIIAFFAKRYILSMVAGASGTFGSTAANAAGSALGNMGTGGLAGAAGSAIGGLVGSGLGALGSAFGSTTLSILGSNIGGAAVGTIAGGGMTVAGSATGMGAIGGAGLGEGMGAAFASNPAGWIALAALAAYAIFAQKQGGPKDSGAGSYSVGADGNITANALTDANRFYRADSHGMDSMVSPIVEATAKSFAAYAKIFGISDLATFTQSTDTDPRGTAPNRAATQAYLNGGLVFSANNQDLGRDAAALTPELQLQASRALLAAFQASNLQADLATLLGSVVAASAPQAAIDALFAQATDLSGVLKALGETKVPDLTLDSLRLLQQAGESLGQTFTRVAQDFLNAQGALNQAIAGRDPVFARNLTLTARNDIATQFLAGMGQELSNAWLERMALDPASFTGLNTASMSLLAQFLNLQTQLEQLDAQLAIGGSGVVPTLISGLGAAGNAALDYARSLADARGSLADYLRGSLLSNLSPLSLTQKYDESQSQLQRLLALAQGGDIGAMGQIGGARDAFLGLSQQRFGFSPTYNSDYFRTFDQTNALTNNAVTRPMTAADAQQQTAAIVEALTANNNATSQLAGIQAQLYDLVKNGISVNDPQVTALLQDMKNIRAGGAVSQTAGAI